MLPALGSQVVGELKCNDLDRLGSLDGVFSKVAAIGWNSEPSPVPGISGPASSFDAASGMIESGVIR